MGNRRVAREAALQLLFQENFAGGISAPYSLVKTETDTGCADFSRRLVEGVLRYRADIDKTIKAHAENWAADRMAIVDLNVLRIAIFEMIYEQETPAKVIMNEAIEIAKKYGNENSGAFVNGILDAIHLAKSLDVGACSLRNAPTPRARTGKARSSRTDVGALLAYAPNAPTPRARTGKARSSLSPSRPNGSAIIVAGRACQRPNEAAIPALGCASSMGD